ncbi:hypothetical protein ScPMuIL_003574 [Solemya velum]
MLSIKTDTVNYKTQYSVTEGIVIASAMLSNMKNLTHCGGNADSVHFNDHPRNDQQFELVVTNSANPFYPTHTQLPSGNMHIRNGVGTISPGHTEIQTDNFTIMPGHTPCQEDSNAVLPLSGIGDTVRQSMEVISNGSRVESSFVHGTWDYQSGHCPCGALVQNANRQHSNCTDIGSNCPDGGTNDPDGGTTCPDGESNSPDDGFNCPDGGASCPDSVSNCPNGEHFTTRMEMDKQQSITSDDDAYLQIDDKDLLKAAQEVSESGSMLPLLKQELRFKIQSRRLSEGRSELFVNFAEIKKDQLTKEDISRREARRLTNRKSAQKSRIKRKKHLEKQQQIIAKLEKRNRVLNFRLHEMTSLKQEMVNFLRNHALLNRMQHCDMPRCIATSNLLQYSDIAVRVGICLERTPRNTGRENKATSSCNGHGYSHGDWRRMLSTTPQQEEPCTGTGSEEVDQSLQDAYGECCQNGALTPLIKHELKCKIQLQRLSLGLDEIELSQQSTTIKFTLTEEEILKKNIRRRQNRESANRMRQQQRDYVTNLEHKIVALQQKNKRLLEAKSDIERAGDPARVKKIKWTSLLD